MLHLRGGASHAGIEQPRPGRCKAMFAELSDFSDEQLDDSLCEDLDLPMSVGAVAMSLSTIIVAANAQLLRRLKLQRVAL